MDYDKILSRRAVALKPSGIRRFFDIAAEMDDVISLGVGEPDFKTPWSIRRAGIESLERGHTWYTANSGLAPLKKEIANYLRRRFTLEYDAKTEVLVTVGGSEAIDLAIRTLVNPGDEVLVVEPSFVCYTPITALTDGVPVPIATKPEDGFRPGAFGQCVALCTKGALHEMVAPALLAIIVPIATGLILGPTGVVGLLGGVSVTGFAMAVFMSNAGGAWDNAKKYIEGGHHGGKGSDCHKAAVVGDTVGDPFKDTSGPSLNILIKLMTVVALVIAPLIMK